MDLEAKRADSDTCQAAAWAGAGGIERFQGDMIARRKREPSARKSVTATPVGVKNAYPGAESPFRSVTPRNPEMIADPNGIDFNTKTYRFRQFSGPSYRGAHAGWPAARLGGQLGRRLAGCGGALISRRNRCAFAPAKLT